MEYIREILKLTLPALIVFVTVYYMMKYHYRSVHSIELAKLRKESGKTTLTLRLQAYERLAMFCERISPENLILRMKTKSMSSRELHDMLILAIKQEFDHNLTQQIYVSEKLWYIIEMTKNQVIEILSMSLQATHGVEGNDFAETVISSVEERNPVDTALKAIRKEVEIYFT